MSDDPWNDPRTQQWRHQIEEELMPMIKGSTVGISICPSGEADVKFAVELGLMIMMNKPIIVVAEPGQHIPAKLLKVADKVVRGRVGDATFNDEIMQAIEWL